jgi:hypothetical protein
MFDTHVCIMHHALCTPYTKISNNTLHYLSFLSQPHFEESEDETHIPRMGTWESVGTPKTSEFNCRGQKTSHCGVLHIIGKLLKRRCRKWARMSHLDICNASYGKKKGRESNWQFDSRPLKVENLPDPGAYKWNAAHRWKVLDKSYKFVWDLIPIGGMSKELWPHKVAGVQTETISGLLLGNPGIKSHLDAGAVERRKEYYMGEGGGFPQVRAVVSLVSSELPVACFNTKGLQNVN